MKSRLIFSSLIAILVLSAFILAPATQAGAQAGGIDWTIPVNLSNSTSTSTDPYLLADPSGVVHLFWAEKRGATPGNQADTILYTNWNGLSWAEPIDIFFSPASDGNPVATFPHAVIDEKGTIHLIWMSQPNFPNFALNYSSVPAWQASDASKWQPAQVLARNLTGQKYSLDIAYNATQGLHVVYARGIGGIEGRGVAYMNSMDGGQTWTDPVDIYTIPDPERGASDTRILLDPPNNIYVTWTEWDATGNGQAIYFTSSTDNGLTWTPAFPLDVRVGNEYERDWNNMTLLAPGQIASIWEGGFRAYRGGQYSYDAGKTWTDPVDTFPYLIGDNGSVEFVRDGSGGLHVFVASRVREGFDTIYGDKLGLWHSVWLGDQRWSDPTLETLNGGADMITNPKVAVMLGNQIVAVWYGSSIYDIMAQTGTIQGAAAIPPVPWDETPVVQSSPTPRLEPGHRRHSHAQPHRYHPDG